MVLSVLSVLSVLVSVVAFQPSGAAVPDHRIDVDVADLAGQGTSADPYRITNASELQAMADDLDAYYVLAADVDASETATWNGGMGFAPVGNDSTPFEGTLDGGGHTVTGLTIDRPGTSVVGLFGALGSDGTVTDVGLEDVSITGRELVGGLVGANRGTVTDSVGSGAVTGTYTVGGLVGLNEGGTVADSAADVTVTGEFHVGGLVGFSWYQGTVTGSVATGNVTGSSCVGGLVGASIDSTVDRSAANGTVTGHEQVGGLVGTVIAVESSTVTDSVASGAVTGQEQVGGLVGVIVAFETSRVERSAATGTVTGVARVGGLVGQNFATGDGAVAVVEATATGTVTGETLVGGLVGENVADDATGTPADVTVDRSAANGSVTGVDRVGGLVGRNVASTVDRSAATGPVTGTFVVGGLVGSNSEASTVERSAATGSVTGESRVGGLVGWNTASTVANAYATGSVGSSGAVGALVGRNERGGTVSESYATGALTGGTPGSGLVGEPLETGVVTDSYWDTDTTGIEADPSRNGVGTGLTTARMTGANAIDNVTGFDFPATWLLTASYPALAHEDVGPFFVVNVTATTGPVEGGDTLRVTASVTNYGRPGTGAVSLYDTGFGDTVQDRAEVELDTGERESVTLSWTPRDEDSGTGALTVASGHDADTVVVSVGSEAPTTDGPSLGLGPEFAVLLALLALGLVVVLGRRRLRPHSRSRTRL